MTARFWIAAGLLSSLGTLAVSAAPTKAPLRRKVLPARPAARRQLPLKSAVPVDPGTRAMTLDEARTAVAMLGDAYDLLLEETHSVYHTRPSTPVAATVVRKLQARMTELGWPRSRFVAVNAVVMHPDHVPKDAFEKQTVQALRRGDERIEQVTSNQLRVSTVVSLGGSCASCHWTSSGQTPKAATSWTVPLRQSLAGRDEQQAR